jgi:hypothetical protein
MNEFLHPTLDVGEQCAQRISDSLLVGGRDRFDAAGVELEWATAHERRRARMSSRGSAASGSVTVGALRRS